MSPSWAALLAYSLKSRFPELEIPQHVQHPPELLQPAPWNSGDRGADGEQEAHAASSASDLGVSCLPPASMALWQVNLLACTQSKNLRPFNSF